MEPPQSLQVLRVNHRDKLTDALEAMFYEESLCDVTICCSGQQVKAHRVILAACSQYFKQIFSSTVAGQYPIVFIKAITIEDLNAILEFAYKGEVTVPHAQIESLIGSAETLGVTGLGKINLHEQDFMINGQVSPRVNGNGNSSASSSPSHGSETNGNYISRQTSSRRETRNAQYQPAQVEIQKNVSIQPLPKKRGKKRKIRDEQPKVEEQIVKAPIAPTRSTPSTSKSSSRESSLGRSSSKHTKSISPVAHAPHFNGRHKMAPPPPVILSSPTTQHEMTDQDIENVEDVELDLPSYTRADEFEDGHRVIPLDEDEDEQEDRASAQTISDSLSSSPDAQAGVSVESPTEQPNITSNGSLDLSQHSTRSDSHETPNKTITKSKLRSWSQQISQSVSTGSTPPPSILTRPSINLAAIKSEINEQLQQGVAAASASTSGISSPATSISTSASVSSSNVISAPSTSSVHIEPQQQQQQHHHQQQRQQQQKQPTPSIKQQQQPSPKPSVIKSAPARPVVNQQPEEEDVKPVLPFIIPPYIKMEARPRGRPRKSVTANAAVVPRPLNPLLGLARSSLAGKIAAAAAGSPSSPIPPTGSPTPQALMTPPPPPPPQTQQQQAHIIPTTPTVPPLRISPKASPSSTPTVTIVNSNGTPIATASANSGIQQQLDPSTPTVVVKKRRGRPPSSSLVNRDSPTTSSSQVKPKTELKVPTLTLKLQQPLTHYLKARTSDSHSHMTSSSSTSSSSSTPSASFVTTIQSPHIPNTFNTSPITTTTQTAHHHHHHHNNNPQMQHNNQQTEYAQSHQPSQQSQQQPLLTITSGSIPPSATIPVPRFTPIIPPAPNEAQQQQYQHQQQQQQQNPGQH